MPDPNDPNPEDGKKGGGGQEPDPKKSGGEDPKPDPAKDGDGGKKDGDEGYVKIPQSKWDQQYARTKKAEDELAEYKRKEAEAAEAASLEKGEHEKVIADLKSQIAAKDDKIGSLESLNETITTLVEAEMENIPEDRRSLIPESLSPKDKLEYIAKNRALLSAAAPGGKSLPKNDKEPTDELDKKVARRDELQKKAAERGGSLPHSEKEELIKLSSEIAAAKRAQ